MFDSVFQYLNGSNIFNMEIIIKDRISSFFGDELIMGSYLMRIFPFFLALSFYFYRKKSRKVFASINLFYSNGSNYNFSKWRKNKFYSF